MKFAFLLAYMVAAPVFGMKATVTLHANPIRKVVHLLETMQKQVEAEGDAAQKAFEEAECYCKGHGRELRESVEKFTIKIPEKAADLKEDTARLAQLKQDVKSETKELMDDEKSLNEAGLIRNRDALTYAKESDALTADLEAVNGAIRSLKEGLTASFIQTASAATVRKLLNDKDLFDNVNDEDREGALQFLQGNQTQKGGDSDESDSDEEKPETREIIGILSRMADDMVEDKESMKVKEETAIKDTAELIKSKQKSISTLSESIRIKTLRAGDLALSVEQDKQSYAQMETQLVEDEASLLDLKHDCEDKKKENAKAISTFAAEKVAISETIAILNDDDALDLFKRTLSAGSSFMQMQSSQSIRMQALGHIHRAMKHHRPAIDFIALALQGKQKGFTEVIDMVVTMEQTLEKDQRDDNQKKEYCQRELADNRQKKEEMIQGLNQQKTLIEDLEQKVEGIHEEEENLIASTKALTKSIKELQVQRREEAANFRKEMSNTQAALQVLKFAKDKLAKTFNGRSGNEAKMYNVNTMLDKLSKALESKQEVATANEKGAERDFQKTVRDADRSKDSKQNALIEGKAHLANLESDLQSNKDDARATTRELAGATKTLQDLHDSCTWLLENHAMRMDARNDELKALADAKQVLLGANSFLQVRQQTFLSP